MNKSADNQPEATQWILDIVWAVPNMPRAVGPFDSIDEAERWAGMNVLNGDVTLIPLAAPYARSRRPARVEVSG